ncbi:MAG: ABC transporter permease [Bifidobacterium mongoliense]|uniref:ABC transporter permease n=1 Tax=Bifidobacterium mongoliense TaxID=518643 RepID=UPI0026476236|nr:ABC transporter permease [Bifidobacterium mongoliense]MDN6783428.1 ABC transporter permease [Bifidobacterium mongoliense]
MWSITLKLMKHSVKLLVPAGIAVIIGTAFISCTFLFSNTLQDSLSSQMTAQLGQADYVVHTAPSSPETPTTVGALQPDRIRGIAGVRAVRANVERPVELSKSGRHASSMAVVSAESRTVLPVDVVAGTQPVRSGQIAIPRALAEQIKAVVGDEIEVEDSVGGVGDGADPASQHLRIVGFTEDPHGAYAYYSGASIVPEDAMAAFYGKSARFTDLPASILLLDVDAAHTDTALKDVTDSLPRGLAVSSRAEMGSQALESLGDSNTNPVTIFLMVFGAIAMFVAALVIANTFQVLVAQRRRIFALLRTIGATRGQVYRSVIAEALFFGCVASLIGVVLGIGLMALVCRTGVMGPAAPNARLVLSVPVFAVPMGFGVVMTALGSLGSARAATHVTPLEALRPIELARTPKSGRIRGILGSLMILTGIGSAVWSVVRVIAMTQSPSSQQARGYMTVLSVAILACLLVFTGLALTAVAWMPRLMALAGMLVSKIGPSCAVAHANIQKNPRRVASTGLALLIGVTLVTTVATGAASGKRTFEQALDTRYSVDLVYTGRGLDEKSQAKLEGVKGIVGTVYAPYAVGSISLDHGKKASATVLGVPDVKSLHAVMRADLKGAVIDEHTALFSLYGADSGRKLGFEHSDTRFTHDPQVDEPDDDASSTADATQRKAQTTDGQGLDLAVRQRDFRSIGVSTEAAAFVGAAPFERGELPTDGHMLLAKVDTGAASLADVLDNAQKALGDSAHIQVGGPIAERVQWESIINVMMGLLIGLLAVAVLIALIGVANTLILSVIERTRESATLRAIGMTRGQLRRSLAVEALIIALVSGVVGVVLGTGFGWLGSYIVFSTFGAVSLPFEWGMNATVLAVAAMAALLASVAPARAALRTSPVEALAEA